MTPIRIENVSKFFGKTPAVAGVSLDIAAGELFFLLGPSGCGKTTLLRILAGFIQPDAGEVYFADKAVTHLRPQDRDAGMVFQTYALWPHLTVTDNVAYGLKIRGLKRADIAVLRTRDELLVFVRFLLLHRAAPIGRRFYR